MECNKNGYIALFDSGVGGISVLRQLRRILPKERYLYFGDSANAPYGGKSTEEVRALTLAAAEMLLTNYPVKALVVACNTATSAAINVLRETYPDRIIVGIEPALKLAANRYPGGRIGVMATEVTLREKKFHRLLERFAEVCTVEKIPAPGLVELVEKGLGDSREADELLYRLLGPHIGHLDALVLGCTHYPLAAAAIARVLGPRTALLDGGEGTARETRRRLEEMDLLGNGDGELKIINSLNDVKMLELSQKLAEE